MHPTALTSVSQQTDAADVMVVSGEGYRRTEHVSNGNSAFCYESSTNGAYFERGPACTNPQKPLDKSYTPREVAILSQNRSSQVGTTHKRNQHKFSTLSLERSSLAAMRK
nr:hypothetical protein HmN_000926600 [Hymenolepis microstoma]